MIAGLSFFLCQKQALDFPTINSFKIQLEQHPGIHMQYRNAKPIQLIQDSLRQIETISNKIRENQWHFEVTDVVNIGIGGSDIGPRLICDVFENLIDGPSVHFVSNLDTCDIHGVLNALSAKNTLFIITSKSFQTVETLENMRVAKKWLEKHQLNPRNHLISVTNNISAAINHKIKESHILTMPDDTVGRFSLWSSVGLICAIAIGFEKFYDLHRGAFEMDTHFLNAPVSENMPIQYALLLHRALVTQHLSALIILPYAHRLRTLPHYLQQLLMESLGKHVTLENKYVYTTTGPFVFGRVGTSSEHTLAQMLMQGTHPVFADFILPLHQTEISNSVALNLSAHCLSQVKILRQGVAEFDLKKQIQGGKIANLITLDTLNIKSAGALLAFYEHVVVTLAFLLNINPFDQWGVAQAKLQNANMIKEFGNDIPTVEMINQILLHDEK